MLFIRFINCSECSVSTTVFNDPMEDGQLLAHTDSEDNDDFVDVMQSPSQ